MDMGWQGAPWGHYLGRQKNLGGPCQLDRSQPHLLYFLSPTCSVFPSFELSPPSLLLHFVQLMSRTSTLSDIPWISGDEAKTHCCLAVGAGYAVLCPPQPLTATPSGPSWDSAQTALACPHAGAAGKGPVQVPLLHMALLRSRIIVYT